MYSGFKRGCAGLRENRARIAEKDGILSRDLSASSGGGRRKGEADTIGKQPRRNPTIARKLETRDSVSSLALGSSILGILTRRVELFLPIAARELYSRFADFLAGV